LRQSNHYKMETANVICTQRHFYPELVFVLSRMGNNRQALALIIEKIGDVKEAIEFVQTKNDDELWEDLIAHSMTNPTFVSGLLENIGGHVDPIKLIRRIPNGMKIPHLRDRLVKIISDYNLQMSLRDGCNRILKNDCVDLTLRLHRAQKRSLRVDMPLRCSTCGAHVQAKKSSATATDEGAVAFFCSHVYHSVCLRTAIQQTTTTGGRPGIAAAATTVAAAAAAAASSSAAAAGSAPGSLWCVICNSAAHSGPQQKTGS